MFESFATIIYHYILITVFVPALIGIILGLLFSRIFIRNTNFSKLKKFILTLVFMFGVPIIIVQLVFFVIATYSSYGEWEFQLITKQYEEKIINSFSLGDATKTNSSINLSIKVPRTANYQVQVYSLTSKGTKLLLTSGMYLNEGLNTIVVNNNSNVAEEITDLAIKIVNLDDFYALKKNQKGFIVSNYGAVIKREGIIYYSSKINKVDSTMCPVYDDLNTLLCLPKDSLSFRQ